MNKHTPKKKWGQNFLIDSNTINKIISSIKFTKNDRLIEVGPGKGAITNKLGENAKSLTAVEIDSNLSNSLKKNCNKNIQIINEDFMKIHLEDFDANIIVGNLPYYITTPILFKIFESKLKWERAYFLMQKEVAERIVSQPNKKTYGRLSVMCQIFSTPKILFNVSPNVFRPVPKVDSCFVEFRKNDKYEIIDYMRFKDIIRKIFNKRRKKLKNCIDEEMDLNIDSNSELLEKRPENITINEFIQLIN